MQKYLRPPLWKITSSLAQCLAWSAVHPSVRFGFCLYSPVYSQKKPDPKSVALAKDHALSSCFLLLLSSLSYCRGMYLCMKLECFETPQSSTFPFGKMDSFLAIGWYMTGHSAVGKCTSWIEVYLENTENAKGHMA